MGDIGMLRQRLRQEYLEAKRNQLTGTKVSGQEIAAKQGTDSARSGINTG